MSIGTGVIVAVAFEQVDSAPNTETGTERDDKGLKNLNSRVKECHNLYLRKI